MATSSLRVRDLVLGIAISNFKGAVSLLVYEGSGLRGQSVRGHGKKRQKFAVTETLTRSVGWKNRDSSENDESTI
jgi:hypothetical protein